MSVPGVSLLKPIHSTSQSSLELKRNLNSFIQSMTAAQALVIQDSVPVLVKTLTATYVSQRFEISLSFMSTKLFTAESIPVLHAQ